MITYYVFIIFITIFFHDESYGKKRINIDGVFYECKSPKNSFERTRGVRNRICAFSSEDKNEINLPEDSPALPVAFPILLPSDFARPAARGIISKANKASFQF